MPTEPRNHYDMLSICCGICGVKKKPKQLRKITSDILNKIKSIDAYIHYDINDDRFPKVICNEHYMAVHERYAKSGKLKFTLPNDPPPFFSIVVPHVGTRSNPLGYDSKHSCHFCIQNKVGRPKMQSSLEHEDASLPKPCSICLQPKTGRGIPHPCIKNKKQIIENVSATLEKMPASVTDIVVHKIIKSKENNNLASSSQNVKLNTLGRPATVQLNYQASSSSPFISSDTLDKIRNQAKLSLNQTRTIVGGIQSDLGRKSVVTNYRETASHNNNLLLDFYESKKISFVTETKNGEIVKWTDTWAVWSPLVPLISKVLEIRNIEDMSQYIIKIMADSGQGKTKICFCIIALNEASEVRTRSSYKEGGVLAKRFKDSGVNKCIMCFCAPEIKETHCNLSKIFDLISVKDAFLKFPNLIFIGDLKILNETFGLMEASSKYPCLYCKAAQQSLDDCESRTVGNLKQDYLRWTSESGLKKTCKNYFNVKNVSLFDFLPCDTPVMKISPLPSLHILLGIFNHLWKSIEHVSEDSKAKCHTFALKNNCIREEYWGKTFEGNECVRLMENIEELNVPEAKLQINALIKFNLLRKHAFGVKLESQWEKSFADFRTAYDQIPNISNPLKIHILFAHMPTFIKKFSNSKGLGFYCEQTGETIHQKFEPIFNKYLIKNTQSEKYGGRLLKSVVEFSSLNA